MSIFTVPYTEADIFETGTIRTRRSSVVTLVNNWIDGLNNVFSQSNPIIAQGLRSDRCGLHQQPLITVFLHRRVCFAENRIINHTPRFLNLVVQFLACFCVKSNELAVGVLNARSIIFYPVMYNCLCAANIIIDLSSFCLRLIPLSIITLLYSLGTTGQELLPTF